MFLSTGSRALRTATRRLSQTSAQLQSPPSRRTLYNGTTYTLNTGAKIPALGFGTWQDKDAQESGERSLKAISNAYTSLTLRSCHNRPGRRIPTHRHGTSVPAPQFYPAPHMLTVPATAPNPPSATPSKSLASPAPQSSSPRSYGTTAIILPMSKPR